MPDGLTIAPGATFYPNLEWTVSGLVGTLGVRITRDSDGATVLARSTAGITEFGSSGEYTATLVAPTTAGEYTIRWDDGATTVGHVASEGLTVTSSSVVVASGTDLCSLAQVRSYLQKATADTAQDALISNLITRASAEIEMWTQREFSDKGTLTRTFRANGPIIDLAPYDLRTATTVTVDPVGSPATTTNFQLRPVGGSMSTGTYTTLVLGSSVSTASTRASEFGIAEVSILGTWGAATTPQDVCHACVITVGLWVRREVAARGVLSPDTELDSIDLQPRSIPGAALKILDPYRRMVLA